VPLSRRAWPAVAVALVVVLTGFGEVAAAASTPSAKSLGKELLSTSYAKTAGFTAVAEKVSTSTKTGVKSCPDGAQEAEENTSNQTGLLAEILYCKNQKAATALLTSVKADGTKTSSSPPAQLGSSAVERGSSGPVYTIYWRQGDAFEFVSLETNIPASSSASTTTTTAPAPPITAAEQKTLAGAAENQFKQSAAA
jgi:hypothetical protein